MARGRGGRPPGNGGFGSLNAIRVAVANAKATPTVAAEQMVTIQTSSLCVAGFCSSVPCGMGKQACRHLTGHPHRVLGVLIVEVSRVWTAHRRSRCSRRGG